MESRKPDELEGPTKKRHRIDRRIEFDSDPESWAWEYKYNQKCPLIRYVEATAYSEGGDHVRFFHGNPERDVTFEDFDIAFFQEIALTLNDFVQLINEFIEGTGGMKMTLEDITTFPFWAEVLEYAKLQNATVLMKSGTAGISSVNIDEISRETLDRFEQVQKNIVGRFIRIVCNDFNNGESQTYLEMLINEIMKTIPNVNLRCNRPTQFSGTTTYFEKSLDETHFMRSFTPRRTPIPPVTPPLGSPLGSPSPGTSQEFIPLQRSGTSPMGLRSNAAFKPLSQFSHTSKKIPDLEILSLNTEGIFPLIIEVKKSKDHGLPAIQIAEQMLTKFFLSGIIFGICITPLGFTVYAMVKSKHNDGTGDKKRVIHSIKSGFHTFFRNEILNVERLSQFFSFIYSVLKWSSETMCMIHKVNQD